MTLKQKNRAERGTLLLFLNPPVTLVHLGYIQAVHFFIFILNGLFIPYCHMYSSVFLFVLVLPLLF